MTLVRVQGLRFRGSSYLHWGDQGISREIIGRFRVEDSGLRALNTGGVALGPGLLNIEKTDIILQLLIITIIQLSDRYIEAASYNSGPWRHLKRCYVLCKNLRQHKIIVLFKTIWVYKLCCG